jgi:hypothetical protein
MEAQVVEYRRVSRRKPRPKKTPVVVGAILAGIVIISAFLVGTGAVFTSTSANPANIFSAGNLHHVNGKDGSAILTADKMKPGDTATGTVVITNDGDLGGKFTLSTSNLTGELAQALRVKIEDQTAHSTLYNGPISAVPSLDAGTFAAGEAHTYLFTVTFPDQGAAIDNTYKGKSMSIDFNWNEVQS